MQNTRSGGPLYGNARQKFWVLIINCMTKSILKISGKDFAATVIFCLLFLLWLRSPKEWKKFS